jgi:hypothetical protein
MCNGFVRRKGNPPTGFPQLAVEPKIINSLRGFVAPSWKLAADNLKRRLVEASTTKDTKSHEGNADKAIPSRYFVVHDFLFHSQTDPPAGNSYDMITMLAKIKRVQVFSVALRLDSYSEIGFNADS